MKKSKWIWEVGTLAASVLNQVTKNIWNFLKAPGSSMQQHMELWLLFQCCEAGLLLSSRVFPFRQPLVSAETF